MAGGRIKGITIELNGDSTKLEASLKSVNSEIRDTESKLKDVNKLLKMDPGNTNLNGDPELRPCRPGCGTGCCGSCACHESGSR